MKEIITPESVWKEYLKGESYNESIKLYENVDKNEHFYIGEQWEGVYAPNMEKPVLNFLHRVVAYFISMIVSDDVAVSITPMEGKADSEFYTDLLTGEVTKVIEKSRAKEKAREMLRNCAVDGDGCFYIHYEPKGEGGAIEVESIYNTDVLFNNPFVPEAEKQSSIIMVKRMSVEEVREEAKKYGCADWEDIMPDDKGNNPLKEKSEEEGLCTVLIRLWKEEGEVHFCKSTKDVMIKPPAGTGLTLYPIAWMNWEQVKNSYHGHSAVTGLIPNQIFVNKLWAMAMEHEKRMAFPKLFYDMTKIREWTNTVGEAVGVAGDPGGAVSITAGAGDMSSTALELVDKTISYTRDFMGASDVVLGNVRPDNTSAIVAVQKASSAPLELQRLSFYRFWEDVVLILIDHIRNYYGEKIVAFETEAGTFTQSVDMRAIDTNAMELRVDVGASSYWSELMQIETANNLFASGVITDAVTYLECVPDACIRNKNKLIARLKEQAAAAAERESLYAFPTGEIDAIGNEKGGSAPAKKE